MVCIDVRTGREKMKQPEPQLSDLCMINLVDTAGQSDYDRLRPLAYAGADCVLICFSMVQRYTFTNVLEKWSCEVKHYCPDKPFVLAGNKLDLVNDAEALKEFRKSWGDSQEPITIEEGWQLAKHLGAAPFVAYSAWTQENLYDLFAAAVEAVLHPKPKQSRTTSYCLTQ
jgi:small GTP-binding protein